MRVWAGPERYLSLAEVEVFSGGRNVARGQPARQSSTYGGCLAERAVDGNTDGDRHRGQSVTHTGGGPAEWWEVDLPPGTVVERIVLHNRTDAAPERLADCRVQLLDERRGVVGELRTPARVGERVEMDLAKMGAKMGDASLLPAAGQSPVSVELAWVPPGEFLMGSASGHRDERPVHRARIERGFRMGRFEVTNAQYRQFDPAHESREEDRHGYQFGITGYDQDAPDQPVVRVSWDEATAFCRWLSRKTGRTVRLPREEEWEWACRAGSAGAFWYGGLDSDFSKSANLGDFMLAYFSGDPYTQDWRRAWQRNPENKYDNWIPQDARFNDGGFVTEPVGRYQPNPWGLHDMHGNAAEWTSSEYRPYGNAATAANGAAVPPRVVRGGSWYDRPFRCTSSFRAAYRPYQRVFNVGFRIVMEE